ncbi:MAG: AtpZ/AtpI family protein [Ignavibacteriae bacterium]|nr:MAG: AtpZ/AtpI family protein [Ignavibacteriota bacterium]
MDSESPDRQQNNTQKNKREPGLSRNVAPFLTMGFQLAAAVVLFFLLGHWMDKKFDIAPYGKLVGIILGCTGGFIKFFKTVASITAEEKKQREQNKRED